ncbi:potassium channel family protein [Novosphingobium sp.]|uniref:potassium channel family protein n=1 Tax=Novosphingobium sp. TaxID=1874826 RepID=UPI0035B18E16
MQKLRAATDTFIELAILYAVLLLVSAALLSHFEGIDFATGLYWAATTATSTGYGDISPKTGAGQLVAVILMHLSIFVVAPLIVVRLVDRLNENRDAFTHEEQLHILESLARIEARLDRLESGAR